MTYNRLFSLITVTHGRWHHLQQTWRTRMQQSYPRCEFIVVASGPEQGPLELLRDPGFRGRVVHVPDAQYYRGAYLHNLGGQAASGEYLGFVDADVFIHPDWAAACAGEFKACRRLVVHRSYQQTGSAGDLTGTCAMERWVWERINGYNENLDLRWGQDDIDLFMRAQAAGARVGGYSPHLAKAIEHTAVDRVQHKPDPLEPSCDDVYVLQGRIMAADRANHEWEANRFSRLQFPPDTVNIYSRC